MSRIINSTKRTVISFVVLTIVLVWVSGVTGQSTPPAIRSATAGTTPIGQAPGAPAGSYPLSGFDNINLFNGNLNFRLPLMHVGGRGTAGYTMMLPIEQHWRVITVPIPHCDQTGCTYYESDYKYIANPNWWTGLTPGYGPGVLQGRKAGDYATPVQGCGGSVFHSTLTRFTFTGSDGTEFELRDALNNGQPLTGAPPPPADPCYDGPIRGKVFVTADGTSATFYSDNIIQDTREPGQSDGATLIYASGILLLRDGTHYRFDNGQTSWIRDPNGNMVNFTYTNGLLSGIDDSLNRHIGISGDTISFKGANGAARTLSVHRANLSTILRKHPDGTTEYTIHTFHELFPDLQNVQQGTFDPSLVSTVDLPDGRQYKFFYDSYANLAEVILPTGGRIEYDWTVGDFDYGDHVKMIYEHVTQRRTALDATTSVYETRMGYSDPGITPVVVDTWDPKNGNALLARSKHYFNGSGVYPATPYATGYAPWNNGREYQTEEYAADGTTLLRRVVNTWQQRAALNWWTGSANDAPPNDPRLVETTTTLADTNQVSKHSAISPIDGSVGFDRYNNPTDSWDYDYGSGAPGALLRHTQTSYVTTLNGADYACDPSSTCSAIANLSSAIHLRGLPSQTSVFDAGGTEMSRASFEYDNYNSDTNHASLLSRSSISGWDSGFTSSYTTRGNPTATTQYLLTNGAVTGSISSFAQFDIVGNVVKAIDGRGYATSLDFSDNFGGPADNVESGGNPANTQPSELGGLSTYAFPFKVTNALGQSAYSKVDYYLARAVATEDLNGVVSSGYANDLLDRPTQVIRAANDTSNPSAKSQTTFAYDDTNHVITTTSDQATYNDNVLKSKVFYDGLGRTTEKRQYEDATNYIAVQTLYDAVGRAYKTSNPFRPWQSETAIWTTTAFDALGRLISVTTPDSAIVTTSYSGNTVTVNDQTAKARKSVTDALGRLTSVYEDPNSLNYLTSYGYDTLDNLTTVSQGSQTRTFVYDSLKRLLSATNPESGAISYDYDNNGNLLHKTDARSIMTTYGYDALNRATTRSYSDGTPTVTYAYDPAVSNGKGRLGSVSSSISSYSYSNYDALGRVKTGTQIIYGQTNHSYTIGYSYDLTGHLTSMTYPSGHSVSYGFDGAARTNDFRGYLGDGSLRIYSTGISYSPFGGMSQEQFGTATAVYNKRFYNSRGQLAEIREGTYNASDNTWWNRGAIINHYSDACWGMCGGNNSTTSMTDNNGNLRKQDVYIPGDDQISSYAMRWQEYAYDNLNRLTQVYEHASASWYQSYVYDRYGNRTVGADTSGLTIHNYTISATTNKLFGPGETDASHSLTDYDAAGNQKKDYYTESSTGRYYDHTYDAENRMNSSTTTFADNSSQVSTYGYDGDGWRVKRIIGGIETQQVYGLGGELLAEYSASGVLQKEYGYRNGQLLITAAVNSVVWGAPPSYTGPDPLSTGDDIKLENLTELRTAVNSLRAHAGLPNYAFTVDTTPQRYVTTVKANHIRQLRAALEEARSHLGLSTTYEHPTLTENTSLIYAKDFQELRDQIKSAWLSQSSGVDVRWLVVDQLGTPRMIFAENGSLSGVSRHDYVPFGEEVSAGTGARTMAQGYSSSDGSRFQFADKEHDNETGLDYFGARYYASAQGRFTSPDPLLSSGKSLQPQSWNRFSYCVNNPLKYADPTGLDWGQWDDGKKTHYHWFNGKVGEWNHHTYSAVRELAKPGSSFSFIADNGLYVTLRNDPRHYYTAIGGGAPQPVVNPAQDQVDQLSGFAHGVGHAVTSLNPLTTPLVDYAIDQMIGGVDKSDPGYSNAEMIGNGLATAPLIMTPMPEAEAAAETTTLYRAVSHAEFEQIMETGTFEQGPNALAGKWFWESAEHAEQFGQWAEGKGGFKIVDAKIPTVEADKFMRIERLDNIGPARYAELHQLTNAVIGKGGP